MTNPQGSPVASFQYDLHSGKMINEWNENNLEVINLNEGKVGSIDIAIETISIMINNTCKSFINIFDIYTNIDIEKDTVQPLSFKLPSGMAKCW